MPVSTDASEPAAPSFLMARVRAAKARARSQAPAAPTPPLQDAAQGAQQAPASITVKAPMPKPPAVAAVKATAAAVIRDALSRETDGVVDAAAVLALFETHAKDTAALDLLRPALPALLDTILAGALMRGTQGFQDRMMLFRMLRVPWTPTMTDRADAKQADDGFANRLVKAVSRIEGQLKHATVTLDFDDAPDARRPAVIEGKICPSGDGGL